MCLKGNDMNVLRIIHAYLAFKFKTQALNAVFLSQSLMEKIKDPNLSGSWTPVHFACYFN
jgi:hypothetical protein